MIRDCPCVYGAVLVAETDSQVVIQVVTVGERRAGAPCWTRYPVRLKDPLGNRAVIEEATGKVLARRSS